MSDVTAPDSLSGDLREHIFRVYADTSRYDRERSHWVMNLEWLNECRRMEDSRGHLYQPGLAVSAPELLLGIPIEIRADGGPPHLER